MAFLTDFHLGVELVRDAVCFFGNTYYPDSMTTLGQRSFSVVDSVGPTLETDVGPT